MMIEIIYKTKNIVAIYKPGGVPSQSDQTGDDDAMSLAASMLKEIGEDSNLWLIHRLDRVVSGLIVFARNKKYAALLSEMVKQRLLTKDYYAVVDGDASDGIFEDLIYKDPIRSKAFIVDRARNGVKEARLICKKLATVKTDRGFKTLLYIRLDTGRFHQIRVQLSHRGFPITGDGKYGSHDNKAKNIALMASHLQFDAGIESVNLTKLPETAVYPWSLFNINDYRIGEEL